ncbi:MAG: hypothetical protein WEF86_02780 [Gemmatimonadota bacterium]
MNREQIMDSMASLRLAGALVSELKEQAEIMGANAEVATPEGATPVASLPTILIRTSHEITAVLNSLYRSRTLLEQAAVPRLHRTHVKLKEVTAATETAAHDMLDKLDRASLLIDAIGTRMSAGIPAGDEAALRLHADLREEAHRLVLCLQFQDIVTQQIGFATHVLEETERRMTQLANQFTSTVFGQAEPAGPADAEWAPACDPDATTAAPGERQALADSVFGNSAVSTAKPISRTGSPPKAEPSAV